MSLEVLDFRTGTLLFPSKNVNATTTKMFGRLDIPRETARHIHRLEGISRRHFTLQRLENSPHIRLCDNKSINGLFVNGKRVKNVILHDGDMVTIGSSHNVQLGFPSSKETHVCQWVLCVKKAPIPVKMKQTDVCLNSRDVSFGSSEKQSARPHSEGRAHISISNVRKERNDKAEAKLKKKESTDAAINSGCGLTKSFSRRDISAEIAGENKIDAYSTKIESSELVGGIRNESDPSCKLRTAVQSSAKNGTDSIKIIKASVENKLSKHATSANIIESVHDTTKVMENEKPLQNIRKVKIRPLPRFLRKNKCHTNIDTSNLGTKRRSSKRKAKEIESFQASKRSSPKANISIQQRKGECDNAKTLMRGEKADCALHAPRHVRRSNRLATQRVKSYKYDLDGDDTSVENENEKTDRSYLECEEEPEWDPHEESTV